MVPEFNGGNFSLDTYGNTELSEVMKIVFTKEIKERISWESSLWSLEKSTRKSLDNNIK